ncbi:MAG: hypothetical protein PHF29_05305 [Candidatus Riflebacteria bacterium]|nr:hypothetical protein [Candidatus Riflebacteria bacterium]MDD3001153.1 hypothetical protein [Candidatus Riflebacteria bacterium]
MAKRYFVLVLALCALVLPRSLQAQVYLDYDFRLKIESPADVEEKNSEFSRHYELTFGNPMLEPTSEIHLDIDDTITSTVSEKTGVEPVITLNNCYQTNAIGYKNSSDNSLSISGDAGRWQIYGEFEQKYFTQIDADKGYQARSGFGEGFRGSIRGASEGDLQSQDEMKTSVSSSYYLEAVYSFKPNLKGRVAFKHSSIDTFETEKTIQVEGIVEPKPNVQIKAGIDNEFGPENGAEAKTPKDTRVYTEFILKF